MDDLQLRDVLRQGKSIDFMSKFQQVCINLFNCNTIRPQLGDKILIILSDDRRTYKLVQVQPDLFLLFILIEASWSWARETLRLGLNLPLQKIFEVIDEVN